MERVEGKPVLQGRLTKQGIIYSFYQDLPDDERRNLDRIVEKFANKPILRAMGLSFEEAREIVLSAGMAMHPDGPRVLAATKNVSNLQPPRKTPYLGWTTYRFSIPPNMDGKIESFWIEAPLLWLEPEVQAAVDAKYSGGRRYPIFGSDRLYESDRPRQNQANDWQLKGKKRGRKPLENWATKYDSCVSCGLTEFKHMGHGVCLHCYRKEQTKSSEQVKLALSGNGKNGRE